MSIFKQGCQKTGPLKYGVVGVGTLMKNWVSHILFLRKGGLIIYLAALKRGLFAPHIRILSYIGSSPPPPPPPPRLIVVTKFGACMRA